MSSIKEDGSAILLAGHSFAWLEMSGSSKLVPASGSGIGIGSREKESISMSLRPKLPITERLAGRQDSSAHSHSNLAAIADVCLWCSIGSRELNSEVLEVPVSVVGMIAWAPDLDSGRLCDVNDGSIDAFGLAVCCAYCILANTRLSQFRVRVCGLAHACGSFTQQDPTAEPAANESSHPGTNCNLRFQRV